MIQPRAFLLLIVVSLLPACGGKNPIEPQPQPPALACPSSISVEAKQPDGASVTFDQPTAREGRPPYVIQCAPSSGSLFPVGKTPVTCTATDADQKQTSCSFDVEVRVSQSLKKTRFLAFGDSLTGGLVSPAPSLIDNPDSYPYKLERMLEERYPAQDIAVLNDGEGGQRLREGSIRLPLALDAHRPEVLLLFQGIISVKNIPTATNAGYLRTMISTARQRGVDVIIATLMPVGAGLEARDPGINAAVVKLNTEINRLAQEFNLGPPVDLYALVHAEPRLIGRDDLHLTAEGYTKMAEKFREAIVSRYDQRTP